MFITRGSLSKKLLEAYEAGRISMKPELEKAHHEGVIAGYGNGFIAGRAEARNMGCILGGYDVVSEAEKLLGNK